MALFNEPAAGETPADQTVDMQRERQRQMKRCVALRRYMQQPACQSRRPNVGHGNDVDAAVSRHEGLIISNGTIGAMLIWDHSQVQRTHHAIVNSDLHEHLRLGSRYGRDCAQPKTGLGAVRGFVPVREPLHTVRLPQRILVGHRELGTDPVHPELPTLEAVTAARVV